MEENKDKIVIGKSFNWRIFDNRVIIIEIVDKDSIILIDILQELTLTSSRIMKFIICL